MPTPSGGWSARPGDAIDDERAERRFVAYAWPSEAAHGLNTVFFTDEHEQLRESIRGFVTREFAPHAEEWEETTFPNEVFTKLGAQGFLGLDKPVQDVESAIEELKKRGAKKVAVTGYCWGGTIAWLAATRLKPDAVSAYYGGGIHGTKNEKPTVPTQMHFGDKDMHIPMTHVNELRKLHPGVQVFDYPADHGFHCDERGSYDAAASKQAMARTLEFFGKHVG